MYRTIKVANVKITCRTTMEIAVTYYSTMFVQCISAEKLFRITCIHTYYQLSYNKLFVFPYCLLNMKN